MSIGINPKLGINTLPELIAQAKKQPGSVSFAVTGVGRLTHLTGELLQIRSDIKLQMVPYTGGSAQALADIIAGRVSLVIEGYAGLAGAYQSGQLKAALAVASAKRLPGLANLPTVAETLPGFVAVGWQCVVAPLGTPQAIVHKISNDLRAVLVNPEIKDKLAARGGYSNFRLPINFSVYLPKWKLAAVVFGQLSQVSRWHGQILPHNAISSPVDAVANHAAALIF